MNILGKLSRNLFGASRARVVVLVVAVLAGVVLLNPLLLGTEAFDEDEVEIYLDSTESDERFSYPNGTVIEYILRTESDSRQTYISLEIISYEGSKEIPADIVYWDWSHKVIDSGYCRPRLHMSGSGDGFRGGREDSQQGPTRLPLVMGPHPIPSEDLENRLCFQISFFTDTPSYKKVQEYYLTIGEAQNEFERPVIRQQFKRQVQQITSHLEMQSYDRITGNLPGDIRIGYQHRIIDNRSQCSSESFTGGNVQNMQTPKVVNKLPLTISEITVSQSDVDKYICYKVSFSNFSEEILSHHYYYVTYAIPPLDEQFPSPLPEQSPNANIVNQPYYLLPDYFDLNEAIRILESLLT